MISPISLLLLLLLCNCALVTSSINCTPSMWCACLDLLLTRTPDTDTSHLILTYPHIVSCHSLNHPSGYSLNHRLHPHDLSRVIRRFTPFRPHSSADAMYDILLRFLFHHCPWLSLTLLSLCHLLHSIVAYNVPVGHWPTQLSCRVQCVLTDTLHGAVYTTTCPGHCSAVFLVFSCFFLCFPCLACVSTCFVLSVIFVLHNTVRLQSSYMMSASTLLMSVSTLLMFDRPTYHLYTCLTCSIPSSIHETTRVPC